MPSSLRHEFTTIGTRHFARVLHRRKTKSDQVDRRDAVRTNGPPFRPQFTSGDSRNFTLVSRGRDVSGGPNRAFKMAFFALTTGTRHSPRRSCLLAALLISTSCRTKDCVYPGNLQTGNSGSYGGKEVRPTRGKEFGPPGNSGR